ncbi:unnamed protein product [Bemisia tabaci]|uniref:Uncharacterized protein n=1 Tax=Bemisia tabaci TaxID=7038 RepID=A0A9P0ALJ0_BEMTA|nr:unnamed protein product [Bemisia tabaci]
MNDEEEKEFVSLQERVEREREEWRRGFVYQADRKAKAAAKVAAKHKKTLVKTLSRTVSGPFGREVVSLQDGSYDPETLETTWEGNILEFEAPPVRVFVISTAVKQKIVIKERPRDIQPKSWTRNVPAHQKTLYHNGEVLLEDLTGLEGPTYQKRDDGSKWYTNLQVGEPMSADEIRLFWNLQGKVEKAIDVAKKGRKKSEDGLSIKLDGSGAISFRSRSVPTELGTGRWGRLKSLIRGGSLSRARSFMSVASSGSGSLRGVDSQTFSTSASPDRTSSPSRQIALSNYFNLLGNSGKPQTLFTLEKGLEVEICLLQAHH